MDSVCREREVLRKNQKDMLEIKNTVTETNNAFDSVISRLDMAEERISELDIATECSKNKENKTWRWGWGRSKPEDRKVI